MPLISKYVVTNPRRSILWPASIAFILAYPFLYLEIAKLPSPFSLSRENDIVYVQQALILAQNSVWDNGRPCLLPILDLASSDPFGSIVSTQLPAIYLELNHTAQDFDIDISSLGFLDADNNGGASRLDLKSFLLIYLYQSKEDGTAWENVLKEHKGGEGLLYRDSWEPWVLDNNSENSPVGVDLTVSEKGSPVPGPGPGPGPPPKSIAMSMVSPLICLSLLIYSMVALYMAISFMNVSMIRSVAGFSVAYIVQLFLSMGVAGTIVSMFYHLEVVALDHMILVAIRIISVSLEGIQNLLTAIAKTPEEQSSLVRVSYASRQARLSTWKKALTTCVVLSIPFAPLLNSSEYLKSLCLFCIVSILADYTMNMTYLTAVVSVDLRRFELEDLINSDLDMSSSPPISSSLPPSQLMSDQYGYFPLGQTYLTTTQSKYQNQSILDGADSSYSIWRIRFQSFLYFKHLYWKNVPQGVVTAVIVLYLYLTTPHGKPSYLDDFVKLNMDSNHLSRFYESLLFRVADIWTSKLYIQGTSLLVLDSANKTFHSYSLSAKQFVVFSKFSLKNITFVSVIELVSCLSFLLSLTGILMNILLPKKNQDLEVSGALDSQSQEHVSCKDLIGFHTLDVVRIITNGRWFATMSLDHKVCVWKAPNDGSDFVSNVTDIPLSDEFWPLSKIVLNGRHHMIALFSATKSTIKCWNFGKSYLNYYFNHEELTTNNPVMEAFFSGKELVVFLRNGTILIISDRGDCRAYDMFERIRHQSKLRRKTSENSDPNEDVNKAPKKLAFACRMQPLSAHEVCICITETNELIVAVHVGRQWRFRLTEMLESVWAIRGLGEEVNGTVAPKNVDDYFAHAAITTNNNRMFIPSSTRRLGMKQKISAVVPIHSLNMVLLTSELSASLLDVNSGTILRHFRLGNYKPGSLKVIHSQPTHCRFCGCTSLESISLCYADADDEELVIEHTLRSQSLAKSTICLRVERDPRETRCRGFEATVEEQHWVTNVEGWESTDMNLLLGVRRKESSKENDSVDDIGISAAEASGKATPKILATLSEVSSTCADFIKTAVALILIQDVSRERPQDSRTPLLSSTWEAWAMSAQGKITYYDIPEARSSIGREKSSRLLIQSLGPTAKYGHKSIVVAFGNLIKLLYIGEEETIQGVDNDVGSIFSANIGPSVTKRRPRLPSRNASHT